ncbi:unnamed protein product [Arctogadus glacialis]
MWVYKPPLYLLPSSSAGEALCEAPDDSPDAPSQPPLSATFTSLPSEVRAAFWLPPTAGFEDTPVIRRLLLRLLLFQQQSLMRANGSLYIWNTKLLRLSVGLDQSAFSTTGSGA